MKSLLSFAVCLAVAVSTAAAQDASLPPSPHPSLKRAPEQASWTIAFKYQPQPRKADPDPVQSITVAKSGKTYREQIVHTSGQTEEKWAFEDAQLQLMKGGGIVMVDVPLKGKSTPEFNNYQTGDFGGLEWVSPSHFRSAQAYQGKAALLFEMAKGQGKATAILSAETQLPLLYSDEEVTCTYTYHAAPQDLAPPEKILAVLKKHRAGLQKLKYRPSAP